MPKLLILFHSLFIMASSSVGQVAGDAHVQQYTTDNGLPSNGIKGLQWDKRTAFLWIATEAGIVRFNGVDFKSYTKQNTANIASERMLFMVQNNYGKIYTSDQPGNIFAIDKSRPVLWKKAAVTTGINPYLGNYYLLGVSDSFYKKKDSLLSTYRFTQGFINILCISDTSCLIHYQDKIFYYSISLKEPVLESYGTANIKNIFKIAESPFIINNKNEIFLINIKAHSLSPAALAANSDKIIKAASSNSILYWQTGMQMPFFIEGENAWLLNYDAGSIKAKLISSKIPGDSYIKSVQYSEKNNLLFIGTESKGLIIINSNRVQSKKRNTPNTNNRNSYYSQIELENGNILTNESDIIGDNITDKNKLPVKGKFSFNITRTGENLLWYTQRNEKLGYNCLFCFDYITKETKVYPKIKWGDIVTTSGGKIYCVNLNGIGILNADSLRFLYTYPKELKGTLTFDFKEISPGILAIATCSGLLSFNIATNRLDTIYTSENICVRSIWKYREYVFFGTYGSGFYIYKNGKVKSMPLDKNRYLLYPHCFVPDGKYCWISTNRGLFKSSLEELIDAFETNSPSVYYHYYGKKDGMEMTELNGGCTPCALRLSNNTISFPSMDGLLWVNPEKATPILPYGEIYIDEILVNGEKVDADSLAYKNLPAQTQEVVIQLGYAAWCNKENIYLDHQLNDTLRWKALTIDNEAAIRLGNLGPGKYVLRIRKLNGFGKDNYTYKTLEFTIDTPWFQQWWFNLLVIALVIGLFIIFYRIRTKQLMIKQARLEKQIAEKTEELQQKNEVLEKNNTINTRLISIISHDIITPLKFLNVAGKNLLEKKSLMSEELKDETIKEITGTSKELQLLSTNILNWIKYQNENRRLVKEFFFIHEMINQIFSVLNSMAHQKHLKLSNNVNPELQVTQFFEPLKILIYNLVTNAIHFSENGNITIEVADSDKKTVISVSDNGVGMSPEQIKNIMADQFIISSANIDNKKGNGLGYLIIKDLLKMMNAQLRISSEKGKGTTVYVELPK